MVKGAKKLAALLVGGISTVLLRRKLSLNLSHKIALGIGASLLPASLFIAGAPLSYAIVFFSLAMPACCIRPLGLT